MTQLELLRKIDNLVTWVETSPTSPGNYADDAVELCKEAKIHIEKQEQIVSDIVRAIANPGPHPEYHAKIISRHRREWPTLWRGLEALMRGRS